ncbi:diguanylate phosphodiesterase [Klebsiella variicola]|uniref:diguanylate phosphodiesterase n=1 Tax=Klebsiella variicola TaxID=244366 RepID=UPI002B05CFAF|nr:diguanylate phosphodiesterase [Klebsiella variicola]
MLTTIIYRSHAHRSISRTSIMEMMELANVHNINSDVTGILVFNGVHFLQLLEGPQARVNEIYSRICCDARHFNIVELLNDVAPFRRFGNAGMELIDIDLYSHEDCLRAILSRGTTKHQLLYNDRALRFFRTFIESIQQERYYELPATTEWQFSREPLLPDSPYLANSFIINPVVDPLARKVHSFQFSHPKVTGMHGIDLLQQDLESKRVALLEAGSFLHSGQRVSISLLPLTIIKINDAPCTLLKYIEQSGLIPEQIIIEFLEKDLFAHIDDFLDAVRVLKSAGISVAINDFGAGQAGLLLLTKFQPEKIKIHSELIRDIHKNGAKQAVVQSIINCCDMLEIRICATGIEKAEEWMWLESAGIAYFQGPLFSGYCNDDIPFVSWPDPVEK